MTRPPRQYYDDGLVQLDRHALTLRRYHFPSGTARVIPLQSIRGYKTQPLGMWLQRFRLWGTSDLRRWLPLDARRPLRSVLVTLDVPGAWPSPAFTPAEPGDFLAMFDEVLQRRRPPEPQNSETS
ncbi:MAG: hypothetical protein NT156_01995 [Mycobacterium sp.]|jgi:hypothetical protein|nr:hypothetical protein [Mycobacterium sp.]